MRKGVIIITMAVLAVGTYLIIKPPFSSAAKKDKFMTAQITRGPVSLEVTSTGAINSVVTVQVGTQVSGTIQELKADFNSKVKAGDVIARLDPALFKANLEKERANIASAEANILKMKAAVAEAKRALDTAESLYKAQVAQARANLSVAKANVEKARAARTQTKLDLDRAERLVREKTISQSEKDNAQANFESADAQLKAAEAQVELQQANLELTEVQARNARDNAQTSYESALAQLKAAEAQLEQAKAAYELARVNYEHSIITSPIDGIVVSRAVDVGQTVAASLQSPTLFTIANDLSKMQVEATVDEADIGKIKPGQSATFTVDAFPDDVFEGTVTQVRLSPTTVQNVVTYTVIVAVNNTQSKLLPGLTANITFHIERRDSVLRAPNSALRFTPPESLIEPVALKEMQERMQRWMSGGQPGPTGKQASARPEGAGRYGGPGAKGSYRTPGPRQWAQVWIKTPASKLRPIRFKPGLADTKWTEILLDESPKESQEYLKEGQEVVIGTTEVQTTTPTTSPLAGVRRF